MCNRLGFAKRRGVFRKELLSMKWREQLGPFRVTGGHDRSGA